MWCGVYCGVGTVRDVWVMCVRAEKLSKNVVVMFLLVVVGHGWSWLISALLCSSLFSPLLRMANMSALNSTTSIMTGMHGFDPKNISNNTKVVPAYNTGQDNAAGNAQRRSSKAWQSAASMVR